MCFYVNCYAMRRRRFVPEMCMHIYQRTISGFNIFYDREDFLVFYTIFAVTAGMYGVRVVSLCIMYNHLHILLHAESLVEMSRFVQRYTSVFTREYNSDVGRTGSLFRKSYGSAPKRDDKKIRTAIAYLANNPVEKKLCIYADQYRWNFLAYGDAPYPYSSLKKVTSRMRNLVKACREVDLSFADVRHLNYSQLRRLFGKLSYEEKEYLTDYIINRYSPFCYKTLISYFGSYERLKMAVRSNTGSEYDLREDFSPESDVAYGKMIDYLNRVRGTQPVRKVTVLPLDEKIALAKEIQRHVAASMKQICRFLHIAPES